MRVIAGKHRGRVLAEFAGKEVRPTSDRVKESLFGILSLRLQGARVLDLFCGSGALGIESLSRGASEVVFNDLSRDSLAILKRNLALVKEEGRIVNRDYLACLQTVDGQFDLIFSDPPYALDILPDILQAVKERGLLTKGGLLVHESEREEEAEVEGMEKCDERRYGRTKLTFWREV